MAELIPGTTGPVVIPGQQQQREPSPLEVVGTLQALKAQQKQSAWEDVKGMLELTKQGLPPKPEVMEKALKKAGVEIGDFLESQAGAPPAGVPAAGPAPSPNATVSAGAAAGGPSGGYQAGAPVSPQAASQAPAGGQLPGPTVPSVQKLVGQTKGGLAGWLQQQQAVYQRQMEVAGMESSVREHTLQTQNAAWAKAAQTGDLRDLGAALQSIGQRVDPQTLTMMAMDPTQFHQAVDIAAGNMSPAEKQKMKSEIGLQLATNENFMSSLRNPNDMTQVVDALAEGKPIPAGIQRQPSLEQRFKEGQLASEFAARFNVNPQQAMTMAQAQQNGVNPMSVIPEGVRNIAAMQAQTEEARVAVDRVRAQTDLVQMEDMSRRLDAELSKAENAKIKEQLDFYIDAKKAGLTLPEGSDEAMAQMLAKMQGGHVEETSGPIRRFLRWLTSAPGVPGFLQPGRQLEIKPNINPEIMQSIIGQDTTPFQGGGPGVTRQMMPAH